MPKRILIVDDASFMRLMIRDIVTSLGYEVCGEADNGADAVSKYKELKPDLVTMDLIMPKSSGLEGLKGIMESDNKANVIVVSAIDQRDSLMEAIKLGAKDFIIKPFEEERITSALKKVLGG